MPDDMATDYILVDRNGGQWKPLEFDNNDIVVYGDFEEAWANKHPTDLLLEVRYPATGTFVLWWTFYGVEFQFNQSDEADYQQQLHKAVEKLNELLPNAILERCKERGMLDNPYFDRERMFDFVFSYIWLDIDDTLDEFEGLPEY